MQSDSFTYGAKVQGVEKGTCSAISIADSEARASAVLTMPKIRRRTDLFLTDSATRQDFCDNLSIRLERVRVSRKNV